MYLGLDLGTSGLKALLIDDDQAVLGEAHASLEATRPKSGWSEQDPADWVVGCEAVMDALVAEHDLSGLRAIGLSGHMHGATLLDASDNVLRPCILWNDTRSHVEAAEMDADSAWRKITGNIVFPGFTAPKVSWVKNNEPDVFSQLSKVLLPKDYLRFWLTGETVSEMSDAAGTSWLDVGARKWSKDLLEKTGLPPNAMPRLVEGSEASGTVRAALARRWGFGRVGVAGGGGDNAASAVGVGAVRPGTGFVSLGTSGVLFAPTPNFAPDAATAVHTFCHAIPETWHQMGVILSATDTLEWLVRLTGQSASALTSGLGRLTPPGEAMILPYLGGERTPHNDASVRGTMTGISHMTDAEAATKAVLEGVVFAFRDGFDALAATGTKIDTLLAVGGGSRSDYWLSAIASALNTSIQRPVSGDFGGAFGAARLAMMSDGGDVNIATLPQVEKTFEPDPDLVDAFAEAQVQYRNTYSALKAV